MLLDTSQNQREGHQTQETAKGLPCVLPTRLSAPIGSVGAEKTLHGPLCQPLRQEGGRCGTAMGVSDQARDSSLGNHDPNSENNNHANMVFSMPDSAF